MNKPITDTSKPTKGVVDAEIDNQLRDIIVDITTDHDSDTLTDVMDEYVVMFKALIKAQLASLLAEQITVSDSKLPIVQNDFKAVPANIIKQRIKELS